MTEHSHRATAPQRSPGGQDDGVGFVLSHGVVGVDLDQVRALRTGTLDAHAIGILRALGIDHLCRVRGLMRPTGDAALLCDRLLTGDVLQAAGVRFHVLSIDEVQRAGGIRHAVAARRTWREGLS